MWGNSVVRTFDCICCLGDNCAQMKFDKYGRPYIVCVSCGVRVFIHHESSLRGWIHLGGAGDEIRHIRETIMHENGGLIPVEVPSPSKAQTEVPQ